METQPANSPSQASDAKDTPEEPGTCNLSWEEYKLHINLYKFYLDLALKANVFYYLLAGGIITYHFQKPHIGKVEIFSLLLPIIIGVVLGRIFRFGAKKWNRVVKIIKGEDKTNDKVKIINRKREVIEIDAHDVQVLYILLRWFGLIFYFVSGALIIILILEGLGFRSQ